MRDILDYNITCAFTGYRPAKLPDGGDVSSPKMQEIARRAADAIRGAVADGYRVFLCGMAQGFDMLCGELVAGLKAEFPHLKLTAVIPYNGQSGGWSMADKERYRALLQSCDDFAVLSDHYFDGCYFVRNKYLVDNSSRIICYFDGVSGGTQNTLNYAKKRGIDICNTAESPHNDND